MFESPLLVVALGAGCIFLAGVLFGFNLARRFWGVWFRLMVK